MSFVYVGIDRGLEDRQHLQRHPYCETCLQKGKTTHAELVVNGQSTCGDCEARRILHHWIPAAVVIATGCVVLIALLITVIKIIL